MKTRGATSRQVYLRLYDFEVDPYEVMASLPGIEFTAKVRGDPTRRARGLPGSHLLIRHGFSSWITMNGPADSSWNGVIDEFFETLGGLDAVERLLRRIDAKEQGLTFMIPVRGSPLQENNFLSSEMLGTLHRLGLYVGFDFPHFDPTDPTHIAEEDRPILSEPDWL